MILFELIIAVAGPGVVSTPAAELAFRPAPGSPHRVGADAGRPQVGDCNNDGKLDIVVGAQGEPNADGKAGGRVIVLLGDGRGGFKPAGAPIAFELAGLKVALGRIDGDRNLDMLVAAHDSYAVQVLLGDGRGGFRPAPGSPVRASEGRRPHTHDLVAGDVNGDGRLDAVAVNADDDNVSVLLGDGSGRFDPSQGSPFAAGRVPYEGVVLQDLDGDQDLDIVVINTGGAAATVLLGDGRGAFAAAPGSPIPLGPRPGQLAVGDLDGDGRPDLVATHDGGTAVTVRLGEGRGRFGSIVGKPLRLDHPAWGIAIADLDRDGRNDVALGGSRDNGVVILLGDGRGGLTPAPGSPLIAGKGPGHVTLADLNQDGRLDLVTGNFGDGSVSVLLGIAGP